VSHHLAVNAAGSRYPIVSAALCMAAPEAAPRVGLVVRACYPTAIKQGTV